MRKVIVIELYDNHLDLVEKELSTLLKKHYKLIKGKEDGRVYSFLKYDIETNILTFNIHIHLYKFALRKGKIVEIKPNYRYEQYYELYKLFKEVKKKIISEIFKNIEITEKIKDKLKINKDTNYMYYSFGVKIEFDKLMKLLCLKSCECDSNLSYTSCNLKFKDDCREIEVMKYPDRIYIDERIDKGILEVELSEDSIGFEYKDKNEHLVVEIEKNQITIHNLENLDFSGKYEIHEKTFKLFRNRIFKLLHTSLSKDKSFQTDFIKFFTAVKNKVAITNYLL